MEATSCQAEHPRIWIACCAALVSSVLTYWGLADTARRYMLGPVDDAWISLRYAANWAGGQRLCFNPGDRVEGYTNFLLVALDAAAIRCGANPELVMRVIPWAALVLLAAAVALFVGRHVFPGQFLIPAMAGALVCLNPVLVCWAISGMESCLYALLLFVSLSLLVGPPARWASRLSAISLILAAMTRPEAAVLFPCMLLISYLRRRSVKEAIQYAAIFGVGFGVYFTIRALHFGHLFPNPFYAKLDYGSGALARRGALYVWEFLRAVPLLSILAGAGLVLLRRTPLWATGFALLAVAQLIIVLYEGGDHFPLFRFMAPVLPVLGVLALYPGVYLVRRFRLARPAAYLAALPGLAALAASDLMAGKQERGPAFGGETHFGSFEVETIIAEQWTIMGEWLRERTPAGSSLATIAVGAIGYHSHLTIIDPHGITDAHIAHQRRELGGGYAGHEKFDTEYILSRRPSYILLLNFFAAAPVPRFQLARSVWGPFNQAMANHPRLDQAYRYEPIRLERGFVHLHVRRDLPTPGISAR